MTSSLAWAVYDSTGAPVTSATPSFVAYCDRSGNPLTQPVVANLGSGVYGFTPTSTDEATGAVFLVDNGSSNSPRRVSGACSSQAAPFFGWHLETSAGAIWSGAAPTFGVYCDFTGAARTPPAIVQPVTGLFAFSPSADDLATGCAFRVDSPATAAPARIAGSIDLPFGAAPTPGPLKNAALDVANFLDTKACADITLSKGVNLFIGPMRSTELSPAPCVFVLNSGGAAPVPYLAGTREAFYRPTVQVQIRGPIGDFFRGEAIAVAVSRWLAQTTSIDGYVTTYLRDSQPAYLGEDTQQHPQWSSNLELQYVASLS